jgi:hypothetical protein
MEFNDFYAGFTNSENDGFANAGGDVIKSAPPKSVLAGRETASDGSKDATGGFFKGIGNFLSSDQGKAVLAGVKAGTTRTPASSTPAGGAGGGGGGNAGGGGGGSQTGNFWANNKVPIIIGGVLVVGITAFIILKK